jgi:hypothetical protein
MLEAVTVTAEWAMPHWGEMAGDPEFSPATLRDRLVLGAEEAIGCGCTAP